MATSASHLIGLWKPGFAAALLIAGGPAPALEPGSRPDDCLTRLDVANLLLDLNLALLHSRSATLVLEAWCRDHAMAAEPRIVADRVQTPGKPPSAEQLQRLRVSDASQLRHRSVALRCGAHVLSKADNWYVPERLSADMNRVLETTDTPFGKVVADLQPRRRTIQVQTLWSPMPAGWTCTRFDLPPDKLNPLEIPAALFQVSALLEAADGQPISEVNEVYQGALLDFTAPAHRGDGTIKPVHDSTRR